MNKKTVLSFTALLILAGLLFFLPNSFFDQIFTSHEQEQGLDIIHDVFGKVEKKGIKSASRATVSTQSRIQSGDTFYTHADSKILFDFSTPFWLMPFSKVEFVKEDGQWLANLVYGDIKKLPDSSKKEAPHAQIQYASSPITTDTFSSYEFDPIDIDVGGAALKEFSPEDGVPQNMIEKQIFQTLGLHKNFFQGCLIKYYKKNQGQVSSGETVFELTIDVTGTIEKSHIVRSDIDDEDYKKCLSKVLERVRFRNLPLKEPLIALFPLQVEI
ncbi:MAG: hypothetical protein H6623_02030 [Bdellovibrionaceae bacterium]|nr:hypothetical protein [Pseudobdellovibrionaceae bacterium]